MIIRFFLFVLFLTTFLHASVVNNIKEADYYCSLNNKDKNLKGLNRFKSLYIKSMIDNDNNLRIKALQGLIKCSKKLGLAHNEYDNELYTLIGDKKSSSKAHKKKKNAKKSVKLLKSRLVKVVLGRGYIDFFFDSPIKSSWISTSTLKRKNSYKIIYDIEGKLGFKSKTYRLKSVKYLKIAQFTPNKIRIVFEHSRPFGTNYKIKGNRLSIYLGKKSTSKQVARKKELPKAVPQSVENSKKVIVIDPGHGGKDSGAIGYKRKKEKDIVLAIAKRVYKKLKNAGFKVYMTRRGDYFVTLRNRTKFANRVKAHLFISIHANAAPKRSKYLSMKGLETFYLSPARSERAKRIAALENRADMENLSYYSKNVFLDFINRAKTIESNKLAIDIQRNILYKVRSRYKVVDGGVRPGPFWVLVGAQMPAILIEVGYITNPTEAMRLMSPYYQNLIAEGVVAGIESYFRNSKR
ncbi:N-acetylmuramoyl-L-alanine amidase [Nitratiruptor sp. YY08-26]|uniref:N-acetylmuramoyl-L-alanine amidase family protein n=1 Tax=unclassified Nitratiruptor TaxID=2624044 RepID=UPI00191638DE|nr:MULTISPECIES: N-acetylmuramoyl-L-alanine amidase [unclassified Nitratiruptor]BCD62113.1 N-acetylmuramoyl-L-alanine amidase [Nitratiruptor sp. YY08-13]BCD66049.1 N-acetylmuramoyl-L-alanine amidase [Nitratiruptor sp. YY08-26]